MHRYYTHVFDQLLQHSSVYSMYQIRHPFPPYGTHYVVLLLLGKLFSYDLAEKIFVCLSLVCFAYALRTCAIACGPAGYWLSLLTVPLWMPWPFLMGFFNYYLAVALFLFTVAFWQRAGRDHARWWFAFALSLFLLTFTHPVPLLLSLAVCGVDLVLSFVRVPPSGTRFRANRARLAALFAIFCAFLFPASLAGRQSGPSPLAGFGWHRAFVTTSALLMGVSPYNTRATDFWINSYRLTLYLLLPFCLYLAVRAVRRVLSERGSHFGFSFLLCTALLFVALPFLPDSVGGGVYFATRMFFLLWVGAVMAASSTRESRPVERSLLVPAAAVLLAVLTLVPAELYIRPVARDLLAEEMQQLPSHAQGIVLVGYALPEYVRFHRQLSFDPYYWGTALAAVRRDDVLLDAPWMNLNIIPIARRPGSRLIQGELGNAHTALPGSPRYDRSLPRDEELHLVHDADFVLFSGTPEELARGLTVQLGPNQAAHFRCGTPTWYLACMTDNPHGGT